MNKKNTIILISIAITLIIIVGAICLRMTLTKQKPEPEQAPIVQTQNFDETIIKKTHETMNSNKILFQFFSGRSLVVSLLPRELMLLNCGIGEDS